MRPNAILTWATLAITLFAMAAASLAQQPDADRGPPAGMSMMGQGMGPGGMMGMMGAGCPMMGMMGRNEDASTFAEGRIAFIKAELAITDAQKDVWEAYATALRKNLESMRQMRATMMGASRPASPVERLDLHISTMESRLQALKEVKPALSALYATLSEDQKKSSESLLTGMGCMM
jgi:hypothetical protein